MKRFPFIKQLYEMDCGPTSLLMIAQYYGKRFTLHKLKEKAGNNRAGVSISGLANAAESIGFKTLSARLPFDKFRELAPLPAIAYWQGRHFLVVYKTDRKFIYVSDPARGQLRYTHNEFKSGWVEQGDIGSVLFVEPTPAFYQYEEDKVTQDSGWEYIFNYIKPFKGYIFQLFLGMLLGSLLMLVFPFLTQSIVDVGINTNNIGFVNLILLAQLMLTISRTSVEFIRSWLLLHISSRLSINILADFLIKMMKLPISFFDTKMTGDLLQRIGDHRRIESFLSSQTLSLIFSLFNLLIFSAIMIYYNLTIFGVFVAGSIIYMFWVLSFMNRRRRLDFRMFDQQSAAQSNIIQLITSISEIKQQNSERVKRWEWEHLQARQFRINLYKLSLNQIQDAGSMLINETRNIFITYLTVRSVMNGDITFGTMLSIQYIIGQLNGPILTFIGFMHSFQDAQISLERLQEIYKQPDEEPDPSSKITRLPADQSLSLDNISFSYPGIQQPVIESLSLYIPAGKTTAVVGSSGSGKTTLIKLLLKYYPPTSGEIRLGNVNLNSVSIRLWRDQCGVVLQDGVLFSDTIARNIAVADDEIDWERLEYACKTANIASFIETLPQSYRTKIGSEGQGLSQGQKQRILLARVVYRNPAIVILDEATNALDANNERTILANMNEFLHTKTVVVVAHRLSTVINADQIVVLNQGRIQECGTHDELILKHGAYFQLVRNQLSLGTD
ncbi:peptidase domain-containing ABC transporter [Spirosoma linguale]|uniref:ABC transporter related protein n=1 Tax=Spirosoma linguale (strain ATCC 33905 / DSM 74 / LMG 10896 / Claus 1) TaxID=504472 RepID=D2QKP8_SPILD|nr:ABC transporter related protein [Spirosoma linguale DSM 74]